MMFISLNIIVDNILNKCEEIKEIIQIIIMFVIIKIYYNDKNVNINDNNNDLNKNEVYNKDEDTKYVDTSSDNYIK